MTTGRRLLRDAGAAGQLKESAMASAIGRAVAVIALAAVGVGWPEAPARACGDVFEIHDKALGFSTVFAGGRIRPQPKGARPASWGKRSFPFMFSGRPGARYIHQPGVRGRLVHVYRGKVRVRGKVVGDVIPGGLTVGGATYLVDVAVRGMHAERIELKLRVTRNGEPVVSDVITIHGCKQTRMQPDTMRNFLRHYAAWREVVWPKHQARLERQRRRSRGTR